MTLYSHPWVYICRKTWFKMSTVHCSTVYNSQDKEATLMSIDRGMDKDVAHIYNGILLSH